MASFNTILSDIGKGMAKFFGIAIKAAVIAEPIIDIAFPGISVLYNAAVTEAANAENAAIVAGAQSGSGAQKLAAVVAAITPAFNAYAAQAGLSAPTTQTIENYVNAVVATLNAIPSTPSVPAVPTAPVTAPSVVSSANNALS
jgi:hypothetical protein